MRRPKDDAVEGLELLLRVLLEVHAVAPHLPAVAVAILVYLVQQPEHAAKMADLQGLLKISQQRTSQLCHSLERKRLVRLTPLIDDRRSVLVQLTAKSLRLIDK